MTLPEDVAEALAICDRDTPDIAGNGMLTAWGYVRRHLRPADVRSAIGKLRECVLRADPALDVALAIVRAELLRLARENAELHKSAMGGYEDGWHALRNERDALKAELAKLKARIEAAPVVTVRRQIDGDGDTGKLPLCDDLPADYIGKQVALVKLEDEG